MSFLNKNTGNMWKVLVSTVTRGTQPSVPWSGTRTEVQLGPDSLSLRLRFAFELNLFLKSEDLFLSVQGFLSSGFRGNESGISFQN